MSLGARRALAIVLVLVGGLGLCCGLFPGVLLPLLAASEADSLQRLEPLSFVAFEDGTPGREALIEGVLSNRNRSSPEGFIAYTRSVPGVDQGGVREWHKVEEVRPPLLIELPGGLVQVRGDYTLTGTLAELEGPPLPGTGASPRTGVPSWRISGVRAGQAVLVIGTLVEGPEGIELEARSLTPGTREQALRANRDANLFFRIFGWTLLAVGGSMFAGGLLLLLRALTEQQPAQNQYRP